MPDALSTAGIIEYSGANTPGWVSNLGLSLSGGTLTIVDAQGATLTSTNPGWVTVPSTTGGQMISLKVDTALSFNDDDNASSDLTNLGFGITETVDWANDMPFFLYVVNRSNSGLDGTDGNSSFFITRDPRMLTTPSAANDIGDTGTIPVNDSQDVILILTDVTVANYTSLPCQIIGAFRMRWVTSTDDWTVQVLSNADGIGTTALAKAFSTRFTMPLGQNGAAASTYIMDNGGTAPIFTTNQYQYTIRADGICECDVKLDGDSGADGSGSVNAQIVLPYDDVNSQIVANGICRVNSATTGEQSVRFEIEVSFLALVEPAGSAVQNADFGNGARTISGIYSYRAFTG